MLALLEEHLDRGHDRVRDRGVALPREHLLPASKRYCLAVAVWGLGFGFWGFGFEVSGLGFEVWGLRFGIRV